MTSTLFVLALVMLTALVALGLLLRLYRAPAPAAAMAAAMAAPDLQIYKDQLAEVDRDLARGTIATEEAERLRTEIARRLLAADRAAGDARALPIAPRPPALAVFAAVLAPAGALALYAWLGAPGYPDMALADRLAASDAAYAARPAQAQAEAAAPRPPAPDLPAEEIALIDQLRQALVSRPDDTTGLALLVQNEARLGNLVAAYQAQARLIKAKGQAAEAEDHALLANLMIEAAGGLVTPEAEAELKTALQMNPSNGRATYFVGLMFAQIGRPDKTVPLWQGLLMTEPPSAPWVPIIRANLADVAARAGQRVTLPEEGAPSAAEAEAAAALSAEDRAAMVNQMVTGLETRLSQQGGPLEDWLKLLNSLSVLGDGPRASAGLAKARSAFADDPAALARIDEAAAALGIAP